MGGTVFPKSIDAVKALWLQRAAPYSINPLTEGGAMLTRLIGVSVLCGALLLVGAACERAGSSDMEEETRMAETGAAEMMDQVQLPDTTAAALWAYLQKVEYRNNWELWPEKGELYQGQEPHGMLLTTYVNPAAYDALMNKAALLLPAKA